MQRTVTLLLLTTAAFVRAHGREDSTSSLERLNVSIEAVFFSMASENVPKLGHLKRAEDPYERRYGDLVHPLGVRNEEFHANVVVMAVTRGPGKDRLECIPIKGATRITAPAHGLTGTLYIDIFAKGRMDKVQISPGGRRIPYDRWEIVDNEKLILCSNLWWPGQHAAQIGVEINANEVMMRYIFGWGRPWTKTSSGSHSDRLANTVDTRFMDRRGYFDWVWNKTAKWNADLDWLSIDIEDNRAHNPHWAYHPDDDESIREAKTVRWQSAYNNFRRISPGKFIGPYAHPHNANTQGALQGYIWGASGGAHAEFRRAHERERMASSLYSMSDFVCPHIHPNNHRKSNEQPDYGNQPRMVLYRLQDWRTLCEFFRDVAHANGKLCIPHISARDFARNQLVPDFAERLRIASEVFDGWMIFESRTDDAHSELEKLIVAAAYGAEIERLQHDPNDAHDASSVVRAFVTSSGTAAAAGEPKSVSADVQSATDRLSHDYQRQIGKKQYADVDSVLSAVLGGEIANPGELMIGKGTYAKIFTDIVGPSNSTVNIPHRIVGLTQVLQFYGAAKKGAQFYAVPNGAGDGPDKDISVAIVGSNLAVESDADWSEYTISVVVKYRK